MPKVVPSTAIPGTEGYPEDAESLVPRYESISFVDKYKAALHLLPAKAGAVLDIGAGTGADAAWLAARGHRILAVEPTDALRTAGANLHRSDRIRWLADSLPTLAATRALKEAFDLVLVTAVWAHLAVAERREAMPNIAGLLRPDALLLMSLRHGPAPANRRVFDVTAEEAIGLGRLVGLANVLCVRTESAQPANRLAGVQWSWLAFRR